MWLFSTLALAPRTQPAMQLQFSATMRVSQTDQGPGGGPGDGCILARKLTDRRRRSDGGQREPAEL